MYMTLKPYDKWNDISVEACIEDIYYLDKQQRP